MNPLTTNQPNDLYTKSELNLKESYLKEFYKFLKDSDGFLDESNNVLKEKYFDVIYKFMGNFNEEKNKKELPEQHLAKFLSFFSKDKMLCLNGEDFFWTDNHKEYKDLYSLLLMVKWENIDSIDKNLKLKVIDKNEIFAFDKINNDNCIFFIEDYDLFCKIYQFFKIEIRKLPFK
jgi:hypothetical protein